jgi:hypothetical protein
VFCWAECCELNKKLFATPDNSNPDSSFVQKPTDRVTDMMPFKYGMKAIDVLTPICLTTGPSAERSYDANVHAPINLLKPSGNFTYHQV